MVEITYNLLRIKFGQTYYIYMNIFFISYVQCLVFIDIVVFSISIGEDKMYGVVLNNL